MSRPATSPLCSHKLTNKKYTFLSILPSLSHFKCYSIRFIEEIKRIKECVFMTKSIKFCHRWIRVQRIRALPNHLKRLPDLLRPSGNLQCFVENIDQRSSLLPTTISAITQIRKVKKSEYYFANCEVLTKLGHFNYNNLHSTIKVEKTQLMLYSRKTHARFIEKIIVSTIPRKS